MSLEHDITIVKRIIEEDDPSELFVPASEKERANRKLQALKKMIEDKLSKVKIKKMANGSVVIEGDLRLDYLHEMTSLTQVGLDIYMVKGDFECNHCALTDLKGSPRIVNGDFNCSGNELKTLEGGPIRVYKDYNCSNNPLKTLNGAPVLIGGDLNCLGISDSVDLSELKNIEIRGRLRINRGTFGFTRGDFLDYKLRGGVRFESKMNESFQSKIITFLRSTNDERSFRWISPVAWDQITDADVEILEDPQQVVRDFKAGNYLDDLLFFIVLSLDMEKKEKMYVSSQDERFHLPHLLYVLGARNDDDPDPTQKSSFFKGTTLSMAKIADIVVRIPKSKFSTVGLRKEREEALSGANLKNDEIRDGNQKRYRAILAAKRKDIDFATISKEVIDYVTNLLFNVRMGKLGKEGLSGYNTVMRYSDEKDQSKDTHLENLLQQIWHKIDDGVDDIESLEDSKGDEEEAETRAYHERELALVKSSLVSVLKELKDKTIDLKVLD